MAASFHSSLPEWTWSDAHGDYYYATQNTDGGWEYHWAKTHRPSQPQQAFDQKPSSQQPSHQRLFSQQPLFYQKPSYEQPGYQQPFDQQPAYQYPFIDPQRNREQPLIQQPLNQQPVSQVSPSNQQSVYQYPLNQQPYSQPFIDQPPANQQPLNQGSVAISPTQPVAMGQLSTYKPSPAQSHQAGSVAGLQHMQSPYYQSPYVYGSLDTNGASNNGYSNTSSSTNGCSICGSSTHGPSVHGPSIQVPSTPYPSHPYPRDRLKGRDSQPRNDAPGQGQNHRLPRGWIHRLDPRFEDVLDPRAYFKKGRVFMTLVTEMQKFNDIEGEIRNYGQNVFAKTGRFVVIRPRSGHCLCLPIQTYSGRATSKPGVKALDHAALIRDGEEVQYHPQEAPLLKEPFRLIVENEDIELSPMSRINFGKVTTIENNLPVRTIGRIHPACLANLERYFLESLGVTPNLPPWAAF